MIPAKQVLVPFRPPGRLKRFPRVLPGLGRAPELRAVVGAIHEGFRLVTVMGPPGIGKTSLATWAAEELSSRMPAWFCDLSSARTEAELAAAMASLADEATHEVSAVGAALERAGPLLVVLDNFEQLSASAEVLSSWLADAPDVSFLVTSRERLALFEEQVVELAPLPVPPKDASPEAIESSPAVQLLRERVARAGGSLPDDAEPVADVVRALEGIPLAIELAAARTRLVSLSTLADRLRSGEILALGKRSPARHRTLADAIAWSWELLSDEERAALGACAMFVGGFDVAAAEQMIERSTRMSSPRSPSVILQVLRDKSLLHARGDDRLGLYETIREFTLARVLESDAGELRRLEHAHARTMAERAARYNRSRYLLSSAADPRLQQHALNDGSNFARAYDAACAMENSVERSSWLGELATVLCLTGVLSPEGATEALTQALETHPAPSPELAGIVRLALQRALSAQGRFDEARRALQQNVDDEDAGPGVAIMSLVIAGVQSRAEGDPVTALQMHEQAAERLQSTRQPLLNALNTACLGRLAGDARDEPKARKFNLAATDACERLGERWLGALGVANLAQLEQERGSFALAETMLGDAMEKFRAVGEYRYEAAYAAFCGGMYLEWGKLEEARHWYELGEGPIEAAALGLPQIILHGGFALLHARLGAHHESRRQLAKAEQAARRMPSRLTVLVAEAYRTATQVVRGELARSQAESRHRELSDAKHPDGSVLCRSIDGRLALRMLAQSIAHAGVGEERPGALLELGPEGAWFASAGQERVDLRRRGALRRLLFALAQEHGRDPPTSLSTAAMFERGWPGQTIQTEAAATRVRVAVATLRKLGLRELIVTRDDGYRLAPDVRVVFSA